MEKPNNIDVLIATLCAEMVMNGVAEVEFDLGEYVIKAIIVEKGGGIDE